jgi:hypothetical protein
VEVAVVVIDLVGTGWLGLVSRPCEMMMGGISTGWGDVSVGALTGVGVMIVDLVVVVDLVGICGLWLVLRPCGTLLVLVCGAVVVCLWCLGRSAMVVLGEFFIVCSIRRTVFGLVPVWGWCR